MDVLINLDACIGCGICADVCTDTFTMGVDHLAHVAHNPDADHEACAMTAAEDCPTDAIAVH